MIVLFTFEFWLEEHIFVSFKTDLTLIIINLWELMRFKKKKIPKITIDHIFCYDQNQDYITL